MDSNQSGDAWIREILNGHELRCMINFRMSKAVFKSLLRVLESRYNLQTSRHVSSQEMLGIFLYMLGHGASVSQCRERFQRSGATISRYFTIMLEKVSQMAIDIIAPDDRSFSSIPEKIRLDDADFMEYENNDNAYEDIIDPENVEDGDSDDDGELNTSSGSEMKLVARRNNEVADGLAKLASDASFDVMIFDVPDRDGGRTTTNGRYV
ncbi:hypothetical protein V6N11_050340 [Hibiscus sabdariffa]